MADRIMRWDALCTDPSAIVEAGTTAAELGKIAQWNDGKKETGGEFAKLSKPITDAKPGKVAHALDFRADVVKPPRARRRSLAPMWVRCPSAMACCAWIEPSRSAR